jgi:hypothetical protein
MQLLVALPIRTFGAQHCANDCPQMDPKGDWCRIFQMPLVWDSNMASNGNYRCPPCRTQEAEYADDPTQV